MLLDEGIEEKFLFTLIQPLVKAEQKLDLDFLRERCLTPKSSLATAIADVV